MRPLTWKPPAWSSACRQGQHHGTAAACKWEDNAPCTTQLTLVTLPPWAPVAPHTSTVLMGAMCALDSEEHNSQHSAEG